MILERGVSKSKSNVQYIYSSDNIFSDKIRYKIGRVKSSASYVQG